MNNITYWQKRIKYYQRKYGKDSIEVKAAKLNLEQALAKLDTKNKSDHLHICPDCGDRILKPGNEHCYNEYCPGKKRQFIVTVSGIRENWIHSMHNTKEEAEEAKHTAEAMMPGAIVIITP